MRESSTDVLFVDCDVHAPVGDAHLSLSFFADAEDAPRLVEHLNEDPEIARLP